MKPSLPRVVILELNTPGNMLTQVSELPTFPKEFAKLAEDQTLQNDDEAVRGGRAEPSGAASASPNRARGGGC